MSTNQYPPQPGGISSVSASPGSTATTDLVTAGAAPHPGLPAIVLPVAETCQVFISYATEDSQIANQVKHALEAASIKCWIATESIRASQDFLDVIGSAIQGVQIVVVVHSKHANQSKYVKLEAQTAFEWDKKLATIKTDGSDFANAFLPLGRRHFIDARWRRRAAIARLVDDVLELLALPARPREPSISVAMVTALVAAVATAVLFLSSTLGRLDSFHYAGVAYAALSATAIALVGRRLKTLLFAPTGVAKVLTVGVTALTVPLCVLAWIYSPAIVLIAAGPTGAYDSGYQLEITLDGVTHERRPFSNPIAVGCSGTYGAQAVRNALASAGIPEDVTSPPRSAACIELALTVRTRVVASLWSAQDRMTKYLENDRNSGTDSAVSVIYINTE
jgi:hypothetical protein